jgi:ZIP family zinc transporter
MVSEGSIQLASLLESLIGRDPLIASSIAGAFVALTTSSGAAMILILRREKLSLHFSMAFAAGIMLVASFTSLILPAIEASSFPTVSLGIISGFGAILIVERLIPHEHPILGYEGPESARRLLRKVWLIAIAILIHNFPEGIAVGVSVAYSIPLGIATAIAIGIQDIPEGFAVALPVSSTGGKKLGFLIGVLSGVSELLMAIIGTLVFTELKELLPIGMGFAGGAMLFITLKEVIPEVYGENYSTLKATLGLLIGFMVMLYLDSAL